MSDPTQLEWHNLEGLRALCGRSAQSAYVTVALLADNRKESQVDKLYVEGLTKPFSEIVARLQQLEPSDGLPPGGRVRYRVRLWGAKGVPHGGVVVRIAPRGSTRS